MSRNALDSKGVVGEATSLVPALSIIAFWAVAALLVGGVDHLASPIPSGIAAAMKVGVILGMAASYMKFAGRQTTVDQALLTGAVWFSLGIATEIAFALLSGRGWFALLGSPEHALVRDVMFVTWIVSPALFARFNGNE